MRQTSSRFFLLYLFLSFYQLRQLKTGINCSNKQAAFFNHKSLLLILHKYNLHVHRTKSSQKALFYILIYVRYVHFYEIMQIKPAKS